MAAAKRNGRKNSPFANLRRFLLRNGGSGSPSKAKAARSPHRSNAGELTAHLLEESRSSSSSGHTESIIDVDEAMSSAGSAMSSRVGTPLPRASGVSTPVC